MIAGATLDLILGDPHWFPHPVRGLGWIVQRSETLWRGATLPPRLAGILFACSVVSFASMIVLATLPGLAAFWIYSLLAIRSLDGESANVIAALKDDDRDEARRRLSYIVGRDTGSLDEQEILRATIETMAENLSDGIIAPLFFLAIAGPVGMAAYKTINTLDSMVGYRNARYREFGWASARLDDLANFVPARITALLIWLCAPLAGGNIWRSIAITMRDARHQPSPNAGYPEAAMAGALGIQLGGLNFYQGVPSRKPYLGDPRRPLKIALFSRARRLLYACAFVSIAIVCKVKR